MVGLGQIKLALKLFVADYHKKKIFSCLKSPVKFCCKSCKFIGRISVFKYKFVKRISFMSDLRAL